MRKDQAQVRAPDRIGSFFPKGFLFIDQCNEHRQRNLQPNALFYDSLGKMLSPPGASQRSGPFAGGHWFASRRSDCGMNELITIVPFTYCGHGYEAEIPSPHAMTPAEGLAGPSEVQVRSMLYAKDEEGVPLIEDAGWMFAVAYAHVFWRYHSQTIIAGTPS